MARKFSDLEAKMSPERRARNKALVEFIRANTYPVTLEPDGDTVMVSFPDVPGCQTFGDDEEDALVHAVDALETMFMGLMAGGEEMPRPRAPKPGEKMVGLTMEFAEKIERYRASRRKPTPEAQGD